MKKSGELTPASALSPTTRSAVARGRSEGRGDSYYFPGCRRVTNCHCEICLASINATLDLIPSATKLSATKPVPKGALRQSESETPPATSESGSTLTTPATPPIQSTMKSRPSKKVVVEQERSRVLRGRVCRILAGLCLLWVLDSGFSALVLRGYSPKLTAGLVKKAGEESRVLLGDLHGRLEVLQKKLERVVGGEVSNCSSEDSLWELKQEGQLVFHWRCVLYKSIAEEVSVWGSPLRTSGLLTTGFSLRSQTLLSGRITEWSEGKLISNLRTMKSSCSWSYKKWSLAAVQLDADTWVLEYSRNALLESSGLIPGTWEVLRLRVSKLVKEMLHKPWRLLLPNAFPGFYYHHPEVRSFEYPT